MARMMATTVYLKEDQLKKLKEISASSRIPMAEFIRMGVDLILKDWEQRPKLRAVEGGD